MEDDGYLTCGWIKAGGYFETDPKVGPDGKPFRALSRSVDGVPYIASYHYFADDPAKTERYRTSAIMELERYIAQQKNTLDSASSAE